ncbi:MAG: GerMN domain-containing protein [Deltaproteobacteria bacterium]|nr:GerMN domain-containing protein [Deltaproteobacteria bacterium]
MAKKTKQKKKTSSSSLSTVIIAALLTVIAGLILLLYYSEKLPSPLGKKPSKEISLYGIDDEGSLLKAMKGRVTKGPLQSEIEEAVEALIKNSKGDGAIPEGTRLLGVKVKDKTAIIDLSREFAEKNAGGSTGEMLSIYSVVDTVTLNFPEVKEVQLLVEGKREKTLSGHIDISLPLGPDRKIIRN